MSWSIFGIAVITRRLSVDLDNEVMMREEKNNRLREFFSHHSIMQET